MENFLRHFGRYIVIGLPGMMVQRALKLEGKRTKLKRKYFRKLDGILPSKTVGKFLQLENQINLLIDLQIASELPLIK